MAYRMRSLLSLGSRKAQFFVISAVTIVTLIFLISQWVQPTTIIDTSQAVLRDETFVFTNIKEKAISTAKISKTCDDLSYNLDEFKIFAERFAASRGSQLTLIYTISSCSLNPQSTTVSFDINLKSVSGSASSSFSVLWP